MGSGFFRSRQVLELCLAAEDPRSGDVDVYYAANVCSLCGAVYVPSLVAKWKPIAPPIAVHAGRSPGARSYILREQALRARLAKTDMSDEARLRTLDE